MLYNVNFKTGKPEAIDETDGDKNNLEIGRVLHLNGYDCPDYVITANHGSDPRDTSYGARYDCVNLLTGEDITKQAYTLEWLKNKTSNRIQVYITEKVMSHQEMTWALIAAKATKDENDRKATIAVDKRKEEKASLPARYPYLTPGDNPTKNIRTELKREFPTVKFSVRTEHGGTININWSDGPTTEQVTEITGKYQEGNFNGMEDIYEYNRAVWPEVFGGARYVFENRHESAALIARAAAEMGIKIETGESDNYGRLVGLDDDKSHMIYRKARTMSA